MLEQAKEPHSHGAKTKTMPKIDNDIKTLYARTVKRQGNFVSTIQSVCKIATEADDSKMAISARKLNSKLNKKQIIEDRREKPKMA